MMGEPGGLPEEADACWASAEMAAESEDLCSIWNMPIKRRVMPYRRSCKDDLFA